MVRNTIEIIYKRELRNMINKIKYIGLDFQGILFGGLVRDEIIASHYRDLFFEKKLDINNYWNENYDIETKHRLLIPNDMDIYFNNQKNKDLFLKKLNLFINNFNGNIYVENRYSDKFKYINNNLNLNHTKIIACLSIGKTMTFKGFYLKFSIDIISNNNIDNIEPPFYNVDFLANTFIIEKINGISVMRLSSCTGTPIDTMNYCNKIKFANKILNDIINFNTYFVRNIYSKNRENINCHRIIKMIDKPDITWNILNIPFKIFVKDNKTNDIAECCCICLDDINKDDKNDNSKLVEVNTNKNKAYTLHYNCFLRYLKKEKYSTYYNEEIGENECRCPFRNPFNFKDCYNLVEYK